MLAWSTMAIAFQRMIEEILSSSAASPGRRSSRWAGMVFTYAVVAL